MFFHSLVALFALLSLAASFPLFAVRDGCQGHHYCPPSTESTSTGTPAPSSTTPTPSSTVPASSPSPSTSPVDGVSSGSNGPFTGGIATYFYQNGNAGACGQVNSDSAIICALDQSRYSSSLCGQQVQITNTQNGQTLTVTVADDCPTCENANSIDLSVGAFEALSGNGLGPGEFNIEWVFL